MPAPLKSLGSAKGDWRQINDLAGGRAYNRNEAVAAWHNLTPLLRGRALVPGGWHPFKIYQVFTSPPVPDSDWLNFRVRAGRVFESDATGTDGVNDNPNEEELQQAEMAAYVTITSGVAAFWFWLEISTTGTTTAVVRYAANPATAGAGNPNPWPTYPKPDATHIPIGYVDTLTLQDSKQAVIRQYLHADVLQVGQGGGSAQRMRVKAVYSSYIVCRTWDGSSEGSSDVYVAKPPHLRWYASAWPGITIVGISVSFAWYVLSGNIDGQRVASDGTNPNQTEIVVPVYQFAADGSGVSGGYDEIWADTPTGGTGVTTVTETAFGGAASPASAGVVLTLMDDNRNGRYWEQIA